MGGAYTKITSSSTVSATGTTITNNDIKISTAATNCSLTYTTPTIVVNSGSTLTVRFIGWRQYSAAANTCDFQISNVVISGSYVSAVSVNNPSTFTATTASTSQINLAATANGSSNNIVVVSNGTNSFTTPTNGTAAGSVGASFAGGTIIYNGIASGLGNQTGLTSGTAYYYKAFSYDGSNNFSTGLSANATTNTSVLDPVSFTATATSTSQINLSATANGSGNNIVVVYNGTGTFTLPTGGTAAPSSGSYIGGTVIYNGVASGLASHTGLLAGTKYYYEVLSYDISNNFSAGLTANATTSAVAAPAAFSATVDGTSPYSQINLSATANASTNNIVVVYKTANTFTTPTNGTAAGSVGASFASGTIFYKGAASGLGNQTGLGGATTYYYEAFSYDGNNYFSSALTANAATTAAPPSTSSISPTSAFVNGSAFTLTVNGTNFVGTSVVSWNGTNLTTTYVSATQLTASVTATLIASSVSSQTASVLVTTPSLTPSNAQTFTINITPTVTGFVPSSITAGSPDQTITVYGTNLSATSVVTFGGTSLATTFVPAAVSPPLSQAYLTAVIPASNLLNLGSTAIGVTNANFSTTASSATLNFTVASSVTTFSSVGDNTWTCPAGVTSIIVNSWGAGGGGGYAYATYTAGGSGAGGSYVQSVVSVIPGNTYNLTVGAGGIGGDTLSTTNGATPITVSNGAVGGSSFFGNTTAGSPVGASILAVGGNGGISTTSVGTSSVHNTAAGGAAVSTGNLPATGYMVNVYGSAGGASTASGASAGGNGAYGAVGGAASTNYSTSQVGYPGSAPGGGGSGGINKTGTSPKTYVEVGGTGGAGQIQILYNLLPVITSSLTNSDQLGDPTAGYSILATNYPTSFNATGLPSGLTINTTTGIISGTPTSTVGSPFNVTISATNGAGTTSATLVYSIFALPAISSSATVTGKVGTAFNYSVTASNGPIDSFTLVSGVLPTGLTFNKYTGSISGTPAAGTFGIYTISVFATNGGGDGNARSITITILDIPTTATVDPDAVIAGGGTFILTVVGTNLSSASSITWNGTALTTTYVSATQLTASVPSSYIVSSTAGSTIAIGVSTAGVATASNTQSLVIANNSLPITTVGNGTWVCPAGVTVVTVKAWGGGGAGGGSTSSSYNLGGGGAGGSFVEYKQAVTPGVTYNYSVGAGGTSASTLSGTAGGSSYFGNTIAGNPFGASVLATGGAGGTAASGTNSLTNYGGGFAGGAGSTIGNVPSSGAYANIAGTNGGTSIGGGIGVATSGAGGAGANGGGSGGVNIAFGSASTAGHAGTQPGGGGGGSLSQATNESGGAGGAGELVLIWNAPPAISSSLSATGVIGTAISTYTISGTNSPTSFNATGLPSGLSVSTTTGAITGTPTTAGSYNVTISVSSNAGTGTATLVFIINNPAAPSITSASTALDTVGVYRGNIYQVVASATSPAHIASYSATGLPAGLNINASSGIISGTPTTSGSVASTVTATDNNGNSSHITVTFAIATAPNYYYYGSGALNDYHNWYTSVYGGGIQAPSTVFSQANTNFNILSNATTASDAGRWTVNGTSSYINVGSSATSGVTLISTNNNPILGIVNLKAALSGTNTMNAQDDTIPTFGTLDAGSTVVYGGAVAQIISTATYGNLVVSNTSVSGATTVAQSAVSVAGTLTVSSGAKLTFPSASTTSITATTGVVISGTVVFPAGYTNIYIGGTSASLTINSSALIYVGDLAGIALSTTTGNIRTNTTTRTVSAAASYVYNASGTAVTGAGVTGCTNLTINNASGTTTISAAMTLTGTLNVSAGTLACGSDLLSLKSTSINSTAIVAPVSGNITGTATVERFIPAGWRVFRDLGASGVAPTTSIFANWQEGGVNNNGYGIQITGVAGTGTGYDPTTGFDYSLFGASSLYTYTNNTWNVVTIGTKNMTLDPFQGYRALVRGNRTNNLQQQLNGYNLTSATLRSTGKLMCGNVTFNVGSVTSTNNYSSTYGLTSGANNCTLISNPYACTVDWNAVISGSSNMNGTYWYNDPTFVANVQGGLGYTNFVAYNNLSGSSNTFGVSQVGRYIQPGQAFFVANGTSGTPQLNFTESCKSIQSKTAVFGNETVLNRISAGLFKNGSNLDGAVSVFDKSFSTAISTEDAVKFATNTENLTFTVAGKQLAINGYTLPSASDVLPIHLTNLVVNTAYTIKIDASQFSVNGLNAFIYDNVLNSKILLSRSNNAISFTPTSVDAASYANRYSIVFGASLLPVTSIKLTTTAQASGVQIAWTTVGEFNVNDYTVQHSVDGAVFTDISTVAADNSSNAAYSVNDDKAVGGINYYRIKVSSNSGSVSYSNVASVTVGKSSPSIAAYPNPLVGSKLNIAFNNLEAGKYNIAVYNVLGAKVIAKSITHVSGTNIEQLSINSHLSAGSYTIKVSNANGVSYQSMIDVK